jgi:DNA modification methylase
MQRTKSIGLLYKQLKKDSTMSRQGLPDYVLVFRKPGDNPEPVEKTPDNFPVDRWQQWASPVWMDVRQSNTLNVKQARESGDEKHICPLQLDVIERCLVLWSNPGDTVFSPFMGIGSEGVMSVKLGRKFIGTELKPSYFKQASGYLKQAEAEARTLFDL